MPQTQKAGHRLLRLRVPPALLSSYFLDYWTAILDYWNMRTKHDSVFQKSAFLARPVGWRPVKQAPFARRAFQKSVNSRLNCHSLKVPKFACRAVPDPVVPDPPPGGVVSGVT